MKATKQTTITITFTLEEAKHVQLMIDDWLDKRFNHNTYTGEPGIELITESMRCLNSLLVHNIGDSE